MNRPIALLALLATALLTGCQSYTWTERYYRPYTVQQFPPVPEKVPIPLLDRNPREPFTTLGRLTFTAHGTADYMLKAVEHNARKVGADAAVVKSLDRTEHPWERWVPPQTHYHPVTYYQEVRTTHGKKHKDDPCERTTYSTTTWVPEFEPGRMEYGVDVSHSIDAYLIRFKAR